MQNRVKLEKYNLTIAKLMEIIVTMSDEQKAAMLNLAENLVKGDRRFFVRKSCRVPVDFATSDRTHKGHIKNISLHGLFIEAQAPVVIGEMILMMFKLKQDSEVVKLRGEVAHATRLGIGVEFTEKGPDFDEKIAGIIQGLYNRAKGLTFTGSGSGV